jgi:hypothetical protein
MGRMKMPALPQQQSCVQQPLGMHLDMPVKGPETLPAMKREEAKIILFAKPNNRLMKYLSVLPDLNG